MGSNREKSNLEKLPFLKGTKNYLLINLSLQFKNTPLWFFTLVAKRRIFDKTTIEIYS